MDIAIIAAIIGAIATVSVVLIEYFLKRKRKADVQLVDVSVIGNQGPETDVSLLDISVIGYPTRALFPVLDFKLTNLGDGVAFLKRIQFEVLDSAIDKTPILEFYIHSGAAQSDISQRYNEGDLIITIKNAGWGPALGVKLNNLLDSKIRECLQLATNQYHWEGDIAAKEVVSICYPKHVIREGASLVVIEPRGFVEYTDEKGTRYAQHVRYDPYPFEGYKLIINNNGFTVEYHDFAAGIEPSRKYSIFLETKEGRYTKNLNISHKIGPNEVERFQVVVASDKSVTFRLIAKIHYNTQGKVQSKPIEIKIYHPNELWYYHYDRGPLHQLELCSLTYFRKDGEVSKKYDESGFIKYYSSYRYRMKWPPTAESIQEASTEALNEIGWTLIDKEIDIDQGIKLVQEAVTREPNCAIYLDTLGWGYYKKGLYEKAVEWLRRAIEEDPDDDVIKEHFEKAQEKWQEQS